MPHSQCEPCCDPSGYSRGVESFRQAELIILCAILDAIGGGPGADQLVRITNADTTSGFLDNKLVAGTNITLTVNNPGGNETLTIDAAGGGGTPAAPDRSIQFNNAGAFGGSAELLFNSDGTIFLATAGTNNVSIGNGNTYGGNQTTVLGRNNADGSDVGSFRNTIIGTANSLGAGTNFTTLIAGYNNIVAAGLTNPVAVGNDNTIGVGATGAVTIGNALTNNTANSVDIGPSDAAKLSIGLTQANLPTIFRVGTPAGTGKLEVATTGSLVLVPGSTTSAWFHRAGFAGVHLGTTATGYAAIQDGDPNVPLGLTIQRLGGNVAIGAGDPTANLLEIYGDTSIQGKLTVTGAIDPTHLYLNEQAGDPANVANEGILYTKDDTGVTELFYMDSAGNIRQLTPSLTPPGGADTQIQYNNGGTFSGDPNLTWDAINNILFLTGEMRSPDGTGGSAGVNLSIVSGDGDTNGNGGSFALTAGGGAGTGNGGTFAFVAGNSGSGATGDGGSASLTAGSAVSTDGFGGGASVIGGNGSGTGIAGTARLTGGQSGGATGTAGAANVDAGQANGGTPGDVTIGGTNALNVQISRAAGQIGLFGTTPIPQPTTAIAAATFAANTSGIANDSATFDGYTIGQVVQALRDIGALA